MPRPEPRAGQGLISYGTGRFGATLRARARWRAILNRPIVVRRTPSRNVAEARMSAPSRLLAVVAIPGLLAGCRSESLSPVPEPVSEPGPAIATDRLRYDWQLFHEAHWTVTNPRRVPVYFIFPSDYVRLQRYDAAGWHDLPTWYGWGLDQTLVHPVPPGDSLVGVVPLTNDVVPTSGWHRLVFLIYRDSAGTQLWPLGNRVSAAVWIGPA